MRDFTPGQNAKTEPSARVPPHSIEAEQALLGAILLRNDAMDWIGDAVDSHHFFEPLHGRIFETLRDVINGGRAATPVTLKPFFEHEKPIGEGKNAVTVPAYLGRLAASATSIINAKDYARTVREAYDRRQLILIGEEMTRVAYEAISDYSPQQQIEEAEAQLFALASTNTKSEYADTAGVWASVAADMVEAAFRRDTGLAGLSTGFKSLDRDLGGLAPSDLIILAGRPAMGKSALAAGIAYNVAKLLREDKANGGTGGEVSFYSLEMSGEQLMLRQLAQDVGVSASKMREGRIKDSSVVEKVILASQAMADLPLYIDTTGALPLGTLRARARRRKRLKNTKLIVIDYLQLMLSGDRTENRVVEVTKITSGLKALAKELDVPVIALSQLSRQVESREDKRPQLADLRESGSIEQDADIVLFVYRGEYYFTRANPRPLDKDVAELMTWEEKAKAAGVEPDVAEVIRAKHRHGSTGTTKLMFVGQFTQFKELPEGHEALQ